MRFKDNKGITVISLVITIIVMIILAVVTINLGFNSIDKSQDSVISVGIKSVQQAVLEQYSIVNTREGEANYIGTPYEKDDWQTFITSDDTGAKNIAWMFRYSDNEEENTLDEIYYKLDEKDLKELGLDSIPKDQFYIVNYKTGEVYDGVNMTFKDGTPAYATGPMASIETKQEAFVDNPITLSLYKTIKHENGSVSFVIKVEDDISEISKSVEDNSGNVQIIRSRPDSDGNIQEVNITNTITDVTKTGSENQDSEYYTSDTTKERYIEIGIGSDVFSTDDIITIKIVTGAVEDEEGNISNETVFTPFIEVAEEEQKPKFTLGEVFYGENNKSIEEVSSIAENYDYVIGNYTGKKYGKKASIDLILGDSNQKIKSGLYTFQYIWVKDGDELVWDEAQQISINVNKGDKQVKNTIELEKLNGAGKLYVKYLDEDDNKKESQEVNFDTEPPKLVIDESLCDGVYRAILPEVYTYVSGVVGDAVDRNDITNWNEKLVDGNKYIYELLLNDTFAKLKGDRNLPTYLHFWIEDEISGLDTTNDINSIHQISYYFSESNTIPPESSPYSTTISKAKIRSTLENSNELDGEKYMSRARFTRPSNIGINESGEYYIWIQNDEKCIDKLKNAADNSWIVSDKKICVDIESPEIASIEADEDDNAIVTITDDIAVSINKEDIEQIRYAWIKDKNVDFSNIDFNKSVTYSMLVSSTDKSFKLKFEKPTDKSQEYYLAVSLGGSENINQRGYYEYSYHDKAGNFADDKMISEMSFINYEGATDMSFSFYQTDNMNNFSYPAHYHIDMYSDTGSYLIQKMWWKYDYENSPEYSLMVEEGKKEKPTYHSITIYTNNSTNSNTRYAISKEINVLMNGPIIIYAEDANGKIYTYRYVIGTNEGLHNYGVQSTELIYNITRDNNTIVLPFAEYDEYLNIVKNHGVAHIFWEDNDKQGEFLKEDQYYPSHTYDLGGAYSKQVKIKISGNYNHNYNSAFNYNYKSYTDFPDYYNIRMDCNFSMDEIWDDLEYGKLALVEVASFGAHGDVSTGNKSGWTLRDTFSNCKNLKNISAQNTEKSRQALGYVNEFDGTFSGTGIMNLSEMLFKKCNNTKYFNRVFKDCTDLRNVSSGLFDECKNAESFTQIFEGCTSLTSANGLFRNCKKVRYFNGAFRNCSNLTSIDSGLFNATDSSLLEVVRSYAGTSFESTFYSCVNLTSIPENLFNNCPYATNFGETFAGTGITRIPSTLFNKNPMAWYFDDVFNNTQITEIPTNLFYKQTATPSSFATKPQFSGAFAFCGKLTKVKNDIFGSSILRSNIIEADGMFSNCIKLTEVGPIFTGCTGLQDASRIFDGCIELWNVDVDLFKNCSSITDLSYLFANCESLTTITSNLFSACNKVKRINAMFYNCTSLSYLNPNLFDAFKNNEIENISSVSTQGTTNKVNIYGIYENCRKLATAPKLWNLNIWSYKSNNCIINKNNLIPSKFINIFDGNSVGLNNSEISKLKEYAGFAEAYRGTSLTLQSEVINNAPNGIKQLFLNDIETAINNYM